MIGEHAGEITFIPGHLRDDPAALALALWRLWQGEPWDETLAVAAATLQERIE